MADQEVTFKITTDASGAKREMAGLAQETRAAGKEFNAVAEARRQMIREQQQQAVQQARAQMDPAYRPPGTPAPGAGGLGMFGGLAAIGTAAAGGQALGAGFQGMAQQIVKEGTISAQAMKSFGTSALEAIPIIGGLARGMRELGDAVSKAAIAARAQAEFNVIAARRGVALALQMQEQGSARMEISGRRAAYERLTTTGDEFTRLRREEAEAARGGLGGARENMARESARTAALQSDFAVLQRSGAFTGRAGEKRGEEFAGIIERQRTQALERARTLEQGIAEAMALQQRHAEAIQETYQKRLATAQKEADLIRQRASEMRAEEQKGRAGAGAFAEMSGVEQARAVEAARRFKEGGVAGLSQEQLGLLRRIPQAGEQIQKGFEEKGLASSGYQQLREALGLRDPREVGREAKALEVHAQFRLELDEKKIKEQMQAATKELNDKMDLLRAELADVRGFITGQQGEEAAANAAKNAAK